MPPRPLFFRSATAALAVVAASMYYLHLTFYPTSSPDELGWWGTPLGQVVSWALAPVVIPAVIPALFLTIPVWQLLGSLGVHDNVALFVGAVVGTVALASLWGWAAAALVNWRRARLTE